ncbi:MAG: divalent metal cation transporter [Rhodothermaceae bacterium]|nr:divalent metal cation transporter [Rhodothermaceae bacterium]
MRLGTSSIVVAAFVGPGTVLTCASAGVRFGYTLGWVLVFSTFAVFVLQSFTAGTGILAQKGIGEAVRDRASTLVQRIWMYGLIILGLGIGCAAFETGNLAGASAGIQILSGAEEASSWYIVLVAAVAGVLLLLDVKRLINVLAVFVAGMGVVFVASVVLAPIAWAELLRGLIVPSAPEGSILTVIALVGTTIVTYTLFLHPGACKAYWAGTDSDRAWKGELTGMALFIPLGGIVSLCILFSGAAVQGIGENISSVPAFATLLEPVAGPAARIVLGVGLCAAGITSAVTAPLAASIGISELFGWDQNEHVGFKAVWMIVLISGLLFNLTGISPLQLIIAAQAANGVLLPLIAGFVLYLTWTQKAVDIPLWYKGIGVVVVGICGFLGLRTLRWVFDMIVGG